MRYFVDTEFIEDGPAVPIQLVSVGVVSDDGRELYEICSEFDPNSANDWVKENVLAKLESPDDFKRKTRAEIAAALREFVGADTPEFWGYYADYDWVVVAQMFGTMMDLPKGWPMYCRDIKQLCDDLDCPNLPENGSNEHNALADARWNRQALVFLEEFASTPFGERL